MVERPTSILVYVGLDLMGDGLMKLPFVRALRAAFPQARITWLAGKGRTVFSGLLAPQVTGLIDEVIEDADIDSRAAELLRRPLKGRHFDMIIDTQRRVMTSLIVSRIRHDTFVSSAAGWLLSDVKPGPEWTKPKSMIGQMLELLELASGHPADTSLPLGLPAEAEARAAELLPPGPCYVGLAPGAGGKHKCWPLDNYIALARRLSAAGMAPVVLLGPQEQDWIEPVRLAVPNALTPLDAQSSPQLTMALGRRLSLAVANDSGGGHMLAASGVPLISLFGPTPPEKFAPTASRLTILKAQDFGPDDTMCNIPLDAVLAAIGHMLEDAPE